MKFNLVVWIAFKISNKNNSIFFCSRNNIAFTWDNTQISLSIDSEGLLQNYNVWLVLKNFLGDIKTVNQTLMQTKEPDRKEERGKLTTIVCVILAIQRCYPYYRIYAH